MVLGFLRWQEGRGEGVTQEDASLRGGSGATEWRTGEEGKSKASCPPGPEVRATLPVGIR